MNPNNVNRFVSAAVGVNRKRSVFNRSSKVVTSLNAGLLYPIYVDEILPGDNVKLKANAVIRMPTPPKVPVMDNAYCDIYAFFVPNRLVWEHWKEFMGELNGQKWTPSTTYQVPQIQFTSTGTYPNGRDNLDLLSYLGVPKIQNSTPVSFKVNALPVRAYVKIFNDYFWDENLQDPAFEYVGDNDVIYANSALSNSYVSESYLGGPLCPVDKYKDYFTSCLPAPQRGNAVTLPIGSTAPVVVGNSHGYNDSSSVSMQFAVPGYANYSSLEGKPLTLSGISSSEPHLADLKVNTSSGTVDSNSFVIVPSNLWTDLSSATAITVNQLRAFFQTQKFLETYARGGARYIEQLYAQFGVRASDKTLQRSQYLGGKRFPISMTQVAQTSATPAVPGVAGTPQANLSAFSLTSFVNELLSDHFFEEHGFLMVCACIRCDNSYSQGVEKLWLRKDKLDYYFPVFANLGEQPVDRNEIYFDGNPVGTNVFGYQEAWAEYRFKPNKLTGMFYENFNVPTNSYKMWNYTQRFSSAPTLNNDFIKFDKSVITDTMAQSGTQFIADFYFENESVRIMPMYSVPGLIDHS